MDQKYPNIGGLIFRMRNKQGYTREGLAEDICSKKYIYLIEKGERIPSVQILQSIGNKLNVDLLEYIPFMECINPESVFHYCKKFNDYRKANNYLELEQVNREAMDLDDFKKNPWKLEIDFNNVKLLIFYEENYIDAYKYICSVLDDQGLSVQVSINTLEKLSPNVFQFYNLLSIYYKRIGNRHAQIELLEIMVEALRKKMRFNSFRRIYVSTHLNLMKAYSNTQQYDQAIGLGQELQKYQLDNNIIDRLGTTYYILGKCMFYKDEIEEAVNQLRKAIHIYNAIDGGVFLQEVYEFCETAGKEAENQQINDLVNEVSKYVCFD